MGIKGFFLEILPRIFGEEWKDFEISKFSCDCVILDIPGLINKLAVNEEKQPLLTSRELGRRLTLFAKQSTAKSLVFISDKSAIPLSLKDATRTERAVNRPEPYSVSKFVSDGMICNHEILPFDPMRVMLNTESRLKLYQYLQEYLQITDLPVVYLDIDGCEKCTIDKGKMVSCKLFAKDFAEADHAIAYIISMLMIDKANRRFTVRTIDSDVVMILLCRFFSRLRTRAIEIRIDRADSKVGVNLNRMADILAERGMHPHAMLGVCMIAGNDFFHKSLYSHGVGIGVIVQSVLKQIDDINTSSTYKLAQSLLTIIKTCPRSDNVPEKPEQRLVKIKNDMWNVENPFKLFDQVFVYFIESSY